MAEESQECRLWFGEKADIRRMVCEQKEKYDKEENCQINQVPLLIDPV